MWAGVSDLISHRDLSAGLFKQKNLLRIVVLVKWDYLPWLECLGKCEEVFRIAKLPINLNEKGNAAQGSSTVNEVVAVVLLKDHGRGRPILCLLDIGCSVLSFSGWYPRLREHCDSQ